MKRRPFFLCMTLALSIGTTTQAQEDGKEILRRSVEALKSVPAYRVVISDASPGGEQATEVRMEVVNPDLLHVVAKEGGGQTEVFSDGKKMLSRDTSTGKFAQAPASVGALVATARQASSLDLALQMASNIRLVGRESLHGMPASIYAFDALVMGVHASAKVWIADADRRPLQAEGEVNGEIRMGGRASRKIHKHSLVVYDYDPSIRVAMPTN